MQVVDVHNVEEHFVVGYKKRLSHTYANTALHRVVC